MDNERGFQTSKVWIKDEHGHRTGKFNDLIKFRWGDLDYSWRSPVEAEDMKPFKFEYDSFIVEESRLKNGEYRLLEVDHRLVLPLRRVLLRITSADVIHR